MVEEVWETRTIVNVLVVFFLLLREEGEFNWFLKS